MKLLSIFLLSLLLIVGCSKPINYKSCVPEAFKIKEEYDSHFKRELKKYYVFYKEVNVYRLFNK